MPDSIRIRIDYDTGYKAVVIDGPAGVPKRFETGDPVEDFRQGITYAGVQAIAHDVHLMTTSSLDHFVYDVPGYRYGLDDLLEVDPRG